MRNWGYVFYECRELTSWKAAFHPATPLISAFAATDGSLAHYSEKKTICSYIREYAFSFHH